MSVQKHPSSRVCKRVRRRAGLLKLTFFIAVPNLIFAQVSRSPWEGRDIFRQKGCIHCHAVNGEGGEIGPDLGQRNFHGTYLELAAQMWNHFPGMASQMRQTGEKLQRFSRSDMSQLISYLSYLRYLGIEGNERRGRRLLQTKGCTACHKFGGAGGNMGPDLSAIEEYLSPLRLVESMWNHGPQLAEVMQQQGIQRPQFYGSEFVDLATGIRSFMAPTRTDPRSFDLGNPLLGEGLAETKGCLKCHAVAGTGGSGPSFKDMDLDYSVTELAGKMWNHGPVMWEGMRQKGITFPIFRGGEMASVLAYLYGLKLEDPPGEASAGETLVGQKGCLNCHAPEKTEASGAVEFARLSRLDSPEAMIANMWNHAPEMEQRVSEQRIQWPRLEGKDMADLYAYLRSLEGGN